MKIRTTIEYEVNPKDYDDGLEHESIPTSEEILDQEQCRMIAYLGYLWVIHPGPASVGTNVEVKTKEIK